MAMLAPTSFLTRETLYWLVVANSTSPLIPQLMQSPWIGHEHSISVTVIIHWFCRVHCCLQIAGSQSICICRSPQQVHRILINLLQNVIQDPLLMTDCQLTVLHSICVFSHSMTESICLFATMEVQHCKKTNVLCSSFTTCIHVPSVARPQLSCNIFLVVTLFIQIPQPVQMDCSSNLDMHKPLHC